MKKTNKMILAIMILAILLLGVGYASIQNITLNITGTATAEPSQYNSEAVFLEEPIVSDENYITAVIIDETTAQINVSGLTEKGQNVSAIYTVQNTSEDSAVDLSASATNDNVEYFSVSSELEKTTLDVGETTSLTITAELIETPTENVNSTIEVQLTSTPVETEGDISQDSTQNPEENTITIGDITNNNIGEYIDLGNNIVGTESTSDDWRILYKEDDKVYAILADYLPNSTNYATNAGLETIGEFAILLGNSEEIISNLTNNLLWSDLANGINGVTVTGSPTADLLMNSYNTKNGTNLVYTDYPELDNSTVDYDLYVPHTTIYQDCYGYFSTTQDLKSYIKGVITVYHSGTFSSANYMSGNFSIRPVVEIPSNVVCNYANGVWVID